MKLLTNNDNVVIDFGENIIYAKPGAEDGGLMLCDKSDATHIWNREKNIAYMANQELSGISMFEVDKIPEEVVPQQYKYVNNEFIINEDYTPYVSPEERLTMLEDVVNMILLGGI